MRFGKMSHTKIGDTVLLAIFSILHFRFRHLNPPIKYYPYKKCDVEGGMSTPARRRYKACGSLFTGLRHLRS